MNLLTGAFSALLSQSVTALPVMAAVVLARVLLARAPGKYRYALWAAVGFRLLCPVALASPVSLFNLSPMEPVARRTVQSAGTGLTAVEFSVPAGGGLENWAAPHAAGAASAIPELSALEIGALIWLTGLLAVTVYAAVSDIRLRRRLQTAVLLEKNVYEAEDIPTAFVLGLIRPRIYLPFGVPEQERTYLLLHEKTHLRRGDPWWKLLAFGLLAVYWWNPAVWGCFALFCRDMERSCDEAVLRALGPEIKQAYSRALVSFAAGRRFPAAAPLAFGEGDAKRRVLGVLRWKQAGPRVAFAAAVACVFLVLSLCTNAFVTGNEIRYQGSERPALGETRSSYSYSFAKDVRSVGAVLEIYDGGALVNRYPVMDVSLKSRGTSSGLSRQGTIQTGNAMDWDRKTLTWTWNESDTTALRLPDHPYSGFAQMALGSGDQESIDLPIGGNTVLAAAYVAYGADGYLSAVPCETLSQDITQGFQKDVVLAVLRLYVSADTLDALLASWYPEVMDQALTLYSLRNPYVGNMPADGKLLSALKQGELGEYTVELFTAKQPYVLQVNLKQTPEDSDAADRAMRSRAFVLLALIDNLDEVRWTWTEEDGSTRTRSISQQDADAALKLSSTTILQGRAGIKSFSGSPYDVQDLLDFLS